MEAYIERMKNERQELADKQEKLMNFLRTHFGQLDKTEWYLMSSQASVMRKYINVLDARITHAELKENQNGLK
ncbi:MULTISPECIES: hypothetical protein [Megasphaera]|jgi:hypothetical protein|uniref:crAss001_48 related protein n=1 Tax=Megasphaera TaxID=906 RepID=UPI0008E3C3AF|nr:MULTISPECIES: hypothetical protein [Megasphaera]SFH82652.1 hypothetical protein SAMN02910401_00473 [Megasphaera elsdenii]